MSFFEQRIARRWWRCSENEWLTGSLLRLVSKCLHVGVLDGEEFSRPDVGTAQGSILSPLLGNIYLHHVLDLRFARVVQPRLRGIRLIRYADDFVIGFQYQTMPSRVRAVLPKRIHPDKTRLLDFRRPLAAWAGKVRPPSTSWGARLGPIGALPAWSLAAGVQDTACAQDEPSRLSTPAPQPAAPGSGGAARRAGASQSLTGPLQLLRGQWEPEEFGLPAVACPPGAGTRLSRRSQRARLTWRGSRRWSGIILCRVLGSWCQSGGLRPRAVNHGRAGWYNLSSERGPPAGQPAGATRQPDLSERASPTRSSGAAAPTPLAGGGSPESEGRVSPRHIASPTVRHDDATFKDCNCFDS